MRVSSFLVSLAKDYCEDLFPIESMYVIRDERLAKLGVKARAPAATMKRPSARAPTSSGSSDEVNDGEADEPAVDDVGVSPMPVLKRASSKTSVPPATDHFKPMAAPTCAKRARLGAATASDLAPTAAPAPAAADIDLCLRGFLSEGPPNERRNHA